MCTNFDISAFNVLNAFSEPCSIEEAASRIATMASPLYLGGANDFRKFIGSLIFEGYLDNHAAGNTAGALVLTPKGHTEMDSLRQIVAAA